jgi:hypothetical protein
MYLQPGKLSGSFSDFYADASASVNAEALAITLIFMMI